MHWCFVAVWMCDSQEGENKNYIFIHVYFIYTMQLLQNDTREMKWNEWVTISESSDMCECRVGCIPGTQILYNCEGILAGPCRFGADLPGQGRGVGAHACAKCMCLLDAVARCTGGPPTRSGGEQGRFQPPGGRGSTAASTDHA